MLLCSCHVLKLLYWSAKYDTRSLPLFQCGESLQSLSSVQSNNIDPLSHASSGISFHWLGRTGHWHLFSRRCSYLQSAHLVAVRTCYQTSAPQVRELHRFHSIFVDFWHPFRSKLWLRRFYQPRQSLNQTFCTRQCLSYQVRLSFPSTLPLRIRVCMIHKFLPPSSILRPQARITMICKRERA